MTHATVLAELGQRLARARLDRNVSQSQLAVLAGVTRNTIAHAERGRATSVGNLVRMMRALGLIEGFNMLLPEAVAGPLELARTKQPHVGKRRASRASAPAAPGPAFVWGDGK